MQDVYYLRTVPIVSYPAPCNIWLLVVAAYRLLRSFSWTDSCSKKPLLWLDHVHYTFNVALQTVCHSRCGICCLAHACFFLGHKIVDDAAHETKVTTPLLNLVCILLPAQSLSCSNG